MAVLRTVISTLSFYDKQTNEEHYASHINKVIAPCKQKYYSSYFCSSACWEKMIQPPTGRSLAYKFLYMLHGEEPTTNAVGVLDKAFILHADYK